MHSRTTLLLGTALLLGGRIRQAPPEAPHTTRVSSAPAEKREPSRVPPISCAERLEALPSDGGVTPVDAGTGVGSLSAEEVRGIIQSHRGDVLGCFKKALDQAPRLQGKVVVRFVISQTGDVCASKISQSTMNPPGLVEDCIQQRALEWRFPSPKGGGVVVVNYPFILRPEEPADAGSPADAGAAPPPSP